MDGPMLIAAFVAVASLGLALAATLAARAAIRQATSASLVNRAALDEAATTARVARQEASLAVARLAEVEKRLIDSDAQLRAALARAADLERRLRAAEERLSEALEAPASPPPIPSGKSVARLDDLRAALRAQAAEEGATAGSAGSSERD